MMVAVAAIILIGEIGLLGSTPALVRMVPSATLSALLEQDSPLSPSIEPYASLDEILDPTDVIMSTDRMNKIVPAVEGRVVVPGYQTLLLGDRAMRDRASTIFSSEETSATVRDAITARCSATHIVIEPADLPHFPWLTRSYDTIVETEYYVVFDAG